MEINIDELNVKDHKRGLIDSIISFLKQKEGKAITRDAIVKALELANPHFFPSYIYCCKKKDSNVKTGLKDGIYYYYYQTKEV